MADFPLNPVDSIWWRTDRPENLMVIECLVRLEGDLDRERLARVLQERVVDRFPVFRRRPARSRVPGGLPRWTVIEDFRLDDHLVEVRLPAGAGDEEVQEHVGRHLGQPLDPGRSPWVVQVLEGHPDGTILYARLHHVLADGIALTRVLLSLTDAGPDAPVDPGPAATAVAAAPRPREPRPGRAARARAAASATVRTPAVLAKLLLSRTPPTRLTGQVTPGKAVVWCDPVPLDRVKDLARGTGATVNDVLAAALAGALHDYQVQHHGVPRDVTTMIPVNLRPLDKPLPRRLGNRFALVLLRLPSATPEAGVRLQEVQRRMGVIKRSPEPVLTFALLHVIGLLGETVGRALVRFFAAKAVGVTTNVPGPPEHRYLAGTRIGGLLGWVPGSGEQAVGTCIFTYAGSVHVGFKTDTTVVPDPQRLLGCFEAELAAMLAPGSSTETSGTAAAALV